MKDVMGVIYTSRNDLRLRELTMSRAVAALPVLSRYRVIDFVLSSLVNSGARNVGVIMQKNYHSLMDHLGSGKEWDLHTRNDGLFILPPYLTRENVGTYGGMLDALRSNLRYLRRAKQEYLILTNSETVYNMNFDDALRYHIDTNADMTLIYTKASNMRFDPQVTDRHVYLDIDAHGAVTDFEAGPVYPSYDNFYMDVLIIRRETLAHLIDQAAAHGDHDFGKDVVQSHIRAGDMRIMSYEYKGYACRIESVLSLFRFNMDMLDVKTRHDMFNVNPVYTKIRDEVPAKYMHDSSSCNSLVADGCIIEGHIENSILFRGVRVHAGATVKNSIIMQDSEIQQNAEVENVIFDKEVTLKREGRLIGQPSYPLVIAKGTIL